MAQMREPRKAKLDPKTKEVLRPADTVSFDDCAATSVKAPKAFEPCHTHYKAGDKVTYRDETWEVIHDPGYVGLDGRHWVKVVRNGYDVHVPCGMLK